MHWEHDFRYVREQKVETALGITSHQCGLSAIRNRELKYVHFTALPPLLFDLKKDPNELNNCSNDSSYAALMHDLATKLLSWRMNHTDRGLTETIVTLKGRLRGKTILLLKKNNKDRTRLFVWSSKGIILCERC